MLTGAENRINVDGVDLVLLNPGPTHGSGNLAAWFAEEKLLFSSDTILANARYGLMPDIHLANFVRFMRGLPGPGLGQVRARALRVDGPGRVQPRPVITSRRCRDACQQAFVEFVPIWAYEPMRGYVMNKLADRFGDLDGFADHVGLTAIRIVHHYLMGGWSLEDTPEPGYLLAGEVCSYRPCRGQVPGRGQVWRGTDPRRQHAGACLKSVPNTRGQSKITPGLAIGNGSQDFTLTPTIRTE